VPFLIRAPGFAPARVGAVVRLVDLMPTLLDLAGAARGDARPIDGVSLVSLMRHPAGDPHLEAYAESQYPLRLGWSPLAALREGRFKIIDAPRPELYDLDADPFETANVYENRRLLADAMIGRLRKRTDAKDLSADRSSVPLEVMERLAALGYVSAPRAESSREGRSLPDPKDCMIAGSPAHGGTCRPR
jgi:choline-sulfatase